MASEASEKSLWIMPDETGGTVTSEAVASAEQRLKSDGPPDPQISAFPFETVQLNSQGEIVERKTLEQQQWVEDLGEGISLEMVPIPAGEFLMGSPESEAERARDEGPQHKVKIPAFSLGKYPVTQAQWQQVVALPKVDLDLNPEPSYFKGAKRPVENISWLEAVEFCNRLSRVTNRQYRLPSEAEWESACRAGTTTPFYFGPTLSPKVANYNSYYTYGQGAKGIYRQETSDIGAFPGNAFGLFDMHGNVWEWCQDQWHDSYKNAPTDGSAWVDEDSQQSPRLLRGGSWILGPWFCRSAPRLKYAPDYHCSNIGFRVAVALSWPRT